MFYFPQFEEFIREELKQALTNVLEGKYDDFYKKEFPNWEELNKAYREILEMPVKLINNLRIGKQDAKCPKCGQTFGSFLPPRALKCGECKYTGDVKEFVTQDKLKDLERE